MAADLEQNLEGKIGTITNIQSRNLWRSRDSRPLGVVHYRTLKLLCVVYLVVLVINHMKNDEKNHLNRIIKAIVYSHISTHMWEIKISMLTNA